MSEIDRYVNGSEMSVEEFESTIIGTSKKRIKNSAGGNCLFHALSSILKKRYPKFTETIKSKLIREHICDYYKKTFRRKKSTPSAALAVLSKGSEIEKQLFRTYTHGSDEDEGGNFVLADYNVKHQEDICNNGVWGEEVDIMVACIKYKINIVVFSLLLGSDGKKPKYLILTYKNSSDLPTYYLHLRMDGESSHYEAILDRSSSDPTKTKKSRSKESPKEKRSTRKGKDESIVDKLTRFYEKVDKFIPAENKAEIERDFLDIQVNFVSMVSLLESLHSRSSDMSSEQESNDTEGKIEDLANLEAMLALPELSEADHANISKRIEEIKKK